MYHKGFVAANDGNISCRTTDGALWATPTGVSKGYMRAEDLVKLRLDGEILEAGNLRVSSEIKMHLRLYAENPAINAVVHAHPPASTAFAIAGLALDTALYPEALVNLGVVPCVHYERPGSQGIPDSIAPYCRDYHALLLANHGALTWGASLEEAWFRMESLEHYAAILVYTRLLGQAQALSGAQLDEVLALRKSMGILEGGVPTRWAARPGNLQDRVGAGRRKPRRHR
jgi:L-fuculose-phosphate aldolase